MQAKKNAFSKSKESETFTVQLETSRGKALSDKELSKVKNETIQRTFFLIQFSTLATG